MKVSKAPKLCCFDRYVCCVGSPPLVLAKQDKLNSAKEGAANSRAAHEEVTGKLDAHLQQELVDGPLMLPRFQLGYTQVLLAAS